MVDMLGRLGSNLRRNVLTTGILLLGIAVIADISGILTFFGVDGVRITKTIFGSMFHSTTSILIIILIASLMVVLYLSYMLYKYNAMNEQAKRNIRTLLDQLYSNPEFTLVRYEGEMKVHNSQGDAKHRKTYVLRADSPANQMGCYIEARESDDLDRVFNEIKESCSGGTVSEEYRRLQSTQEGVVILGFEIEFDEPVCEEEHTLTMECELENYFTEGNFEEWVHMALPTERSIMKYKFPEEWRTSSESTALVEPMELKEKELGNKHFSRPEPNQIKWEMPNAGFGKFYRIQFSILR